MIGTSTPGQPADLGREHPAGVDHDLGARSSAPRRPSPPGRRGPARRSTSIPTTRVWVSIRTPLPARAGGQRLGQAARVEPAVGRQPDRAEHAVGRHQREARPAPRPAEMSSIGRPNVFAQPAWRVSSSSRSGVDASRSDPTSCQTGRRPVSAGQPPVELDAVHHHPGQRHASSGAGRRGRPSGTWSRRSARPGRRGGRRSSRARRGGRRRSSRRPRRR